MKSFLTNYSITLLLFFFNSQSYGQFYEKETNQYNEEGKKLGKWKFFKEEGKYVRTALYKYGNDTSFRSN